MNLENQVNEISTELKVQKSHGANKKSVKAKRDLKDKYKYVSDGKFLELLCLVI